MAVVFALHHFLQDNDHLPVGCNAMRVHFYFIGYLILLALSTINDAVIAIVSSRGSIFDKHRRKKLPGFLYLRFVFMLLEAATGIAGCYIVFNKEKNCFFGYNVVL